MGELVLRDATRLPHGANIRPYDHPEIHAPTAHHLGATRNRL
jgi:hypothetical protein